MPLLGGMQMSYVNGFAYRSVTPVSDDQVPERLQRAEEVFEKKLWREQLREWDEVAKPAAIKTHRALQSVDPYGLSGPELLAYVTKCRDHHARMIYQHMRFTGAAMLSVGDLLVHLADWASVPSSEVLGMMRGAAPVSAGASSELDRLVTAFAEDAAAREILQSQGDPAQVLSELCSLHNDVSAQLARYLDLVGYRLLDGFDISGRYALELPDALLARSEPPSPRKQGRPPTSTPTSPTSASRCPGSIAPSSTNCWGKPGSCTGFAMSGGLQRHMGLRDRTPSRPSSGSPTRGRGNDRRSRTLHRRGLRRNGLVPVRFRRSLRR